MKGKSVVLRATAVRDIEEAVGHYLAEQSSAPAHSFVDELEQGLGHIALHPEAGSPRFGRELQIPGPRCWTLDRHPYLVFYLEMEDRVDVWRVLHQRRDVPTTLGGGAG